MTFGRLLPDWPAPAAIRAFSTTRPGGFSTGPWSGLNLGAHSGDDPQAVRQNRELLNQALPARVQWQRQVHGSGVFRHARDTGSVTEADVMVSFGRDEVCAVLTADCLPVFFCNRAGDRVGVAHAGWRGLAGGVLQAAVEALEETPGNLLAWLGPAIGPAVYEVGTEVVEAFPAERSRAFAPHGDRYLMDIYTVARMKLAAAGVKAVHGGGLCTFSDPDRFYSYRRDGATGRMAHLIWVADGPA